MNKILVISLILLILILILSVFNTYVTQKYYSNIEINKFKTLSSSYTKDIVLSYGLTNFKEYTITINTNNITNLLFDKIINKSKKIINSINSNFKPEIWNIMSYDSIINSIYKLDPNKKINTTFNTMTETIKNDIETNYRKIYYDASANFPIVLGPLQIMTDNEIKKNINTICINIINNEINKFVNNIDINNLTPNIDEIVNNYITSDTNFKSNFNIFSENKLKPYLQTEIKKIIENIYQNKINEIIDYFNSSKGIINVYENLCNKQNGFFNNNTCTFKTEYECNNMYKLLFNNPLNKPKDISENIYSDISQNIFTIYKNSTCLTSSNAWIKDLVNKNKNNNDISYNSIKENIILTNEFCNKKNLEKSTDTFGNIDCKLNKPFIQTFLGNTITNTINTKLNLKDYETCNSNQIDIATNIPDNLKSFINPLIDKYGPIDKMLCINSNYGCSSNNELVNNLCYNNCASGYTTNINKPTECYKLYSDFENNGESHTSDVIKKKIILNPTLPKNVCPVGYTYNESDKKCWENCPSDYTYNSSVEKYVKNYPEKWDGDKNTLDIKKNAIWSRSQVRVLKCTNSNKPNLIDGLCYANCPAGHVHVPRAPYTCRPELCPIGYNLTDVNTCYRGPETQLAWYTKDIATSRNICPPGSHTTTAGICMNDCNNGYYNAGGICYSYCPDDYRDSGLFCIQDAHIYGKGCCCIVGKCCGNCQSGYIDDGCTCRRNANTIRKNSYIPSSFPAGCSSDREDIASLCYPKCRNDYWSSSATTCETNNCPSDFYKTGTATCQKDAHTINNPNIGVGDTATLLCPDGTQEASPGGICYPNNPPTGYQRHSISLEQWTEKCPDGWNDTGWYCSRPSIDIKKLDPICQSGYNDINNNLCKKPCLTNYEDIKDTCTQICPNGTINNTNTECGREKKTRLEGTLPYEYKFKKRINSYYKL